MAKERYWRKRKKKRSVNTSMSMRIVDTLPPVYFLWPAVGDFPWPFDMSLDTRSDAHFLGVT